MVSCYVFQETEKTDHWPSVGISSPIRVDPLFLGVNVDLQLNDLKNSSHDNDKILTVLSNNLSKEIHWRVID